MKPTWKSLPHLLPLLALLALAPFALWSCSDAGDEPSGPTGPVTVYNPDVTYPGATIVATPSSSNLRPGDTFTVIATFRDGSGVPISNAPLALTSEAGFFATPANPSLTTSDGKVSFQVTIDSDCPTGSYALEVFSSPAEPIAGPTAIVQFGIQVGGGGITAVTLTALASSVTYGLGAPFMATATVTSDCTPVFEYQAAGAGVNTTTWTLIPGSNNPNFFTVSTSGIATGTMTVIVRASCAGNSSTFVYSEVATVDVI